MLYVVLRPTLIKMVPKYGKNKVCYSPFIVAVSAVFVFFMSVHENSPHENTVSIYSCGCVCIFKMFMSLPTHAYSCEL